MVLSQDSLPQRAHKLEGLCMCLSWEPTLPNRCPGCPWHGSVAGGSGKRAPRAAITDVRDYTGCGNGSYHKVRCSLCLLESFGSTDRGCSSELL